ncbi:MAG: tetratricopeptide repeat protein [Myxococcaceae bacterium]|nr:tetratricopeptide repeat protein [Myxococcaceae bacterium]
MRSTLIALLAALASGCFYPADRGRLLEDRIDKLATRNERLEAQLKDSQDRMAVTLQQVQAALEGLDKASRRTDADIGVQLQKTLEDVAALRGTLEEYQHRISELEGALKKTNDSMEARIDDKAAAAKKTSEELKRPDDPKEYLALAAEKAKSDGALGKRLYDELLKKWPKAPEAGEAHFGLGELHYADDKCREAIYEYGKVIQEFAKAKSTPDAYLRSSDCFLKLKMYDEAKLTLDELARQFPKSDAAKQVKGKLVEVAKAKTAKGPKK